MIYLYNHAGKTYKAQEKVREVLTKLYAPTPDGYCGDEDNGQTSAWYVFSALGFYPVTHTVDEYVIGSPLFKKATLHFLDGKSFTISAKNNTPKNVYIQSASLNGKAYNNSYINISSIKKGGGLDFVMDSIPNKEWATKPENVPYSLSNVKNRGHEEN